MVNSIKSNNQGLTLIELLIALVISSIILTAVSLLMSNGVFGYNKQTTMSSLQDDANLTMNHVGNSIMEANYIELTQETVDGNTNTITFVTHTDTKSINGIASNKYIFNPDDNTLYVADIDGDLSSASPLCTKVKAFLIQFVGGSVIDNGNTTDPIVVGISDNIQIKATIILEHNGQQRDITRITNLRNKLDLTTLKMFTASATDGDITNVPVSELISGRYIAE